MEVYSKVVAWEGKYKASYERTGIRESGVKNHPL